MRHLCVRVIGKKAKRQQLVTWICAAWWTGPVHLEHPLTRELRSFPMFGVRFFSHHHCTIPTLHCASSTWPQEPQRFAITQAQDLRKLHERLAKMEGGRKTTMKRELNVSEKSLSTTLRISKPKKSNDQDQKWSNTSKLTLLSSALGPQIDVLVDGHFPRDVAKLSDTTGWQCLSHLFSKVRIHGYKFHSFVWEARNYEWMQAASSLRQWLLQRGGQRLKKNSPKRWRESSAGTPEFWLISLDKEIHKNTQRTSLFHISVSDSATNGLQSDVGGWTTLRGSLIQTHAEMNVTKWKTDEKLKPWQVPLVLYTL